MTPPDSGGGGGRRAQAPLSRSAYRYFVAIPTRWLDNDTYGHVNNVTYYSYFDTAVNEHLIRAGGLDIHDGPAVGYVVETSCRYFQPLSFPDALEAGLAVVKLGSSSVVYDIAIFRKGDDAPAASGHFVHVWVDRAKQRPTPVPPAIRAALALLVVERNR